MFKYEDFSMEAFPKKCGLVLRDFGFVDTVVLKKVFSSLSVVFREFQVLIVDLLSSSSVLLVLYKNSLFFKLTVRWYSSVLTRNILNSSVRFFGSVFSALADFRFSRRVAADTLGKYSSLLCPFYFRGSSNKVCPNTGELQVGPVSGDKQQVSVIQVITVQS